MLINILSSVNFTSQWKLDLSLNCTDKRYFFNTLLYVFSVFKAGSTLVDPAEKLLTRSCRSALFHFCYGHCSRFQPCRKLRRLGRRPNICPDCHAADNTVDHFLIKLPHISNGYGTRGYVGGTHACSSIPGGSPSFHLISSHPPPSANQLHYLRGTIMTYLI